MIWLQSSAETGAWWPVCAWWRVRTEDGSQWPAHWPQMTAKGTTRFYKFQPTLFDICKDDPCNECYYVFTVLLPSGANLRQKGGEETLSKINTFDRRFLAALLVG